jgi:hypothetical protein
MSREAGLAAVRQRRWGEASELLGELAASGQADAAALDKGSPLDKLDSGCGYAAAGSTV